MTWYSLCHDGALRSLADAARPSPAARGDGAAGAAAAAAPAFFAAEVGEAGPWSAFVRRSTPLAAALTVLRAAAAAGDAPVEAEGLAGWGAAADWRPLRLAAGEAAGAAAARAGGLADQIGRAHV